MDEKLFDLITKMYNKLEDMDIRLQHVESSMATKNDVKDLHQEVVALEYKLIDKVNALFDARQMQIDHETSMARDIKQVQGTVEKIELKIIRNS